MAPRRKLQAKPTRPATQPHRTVKPNPLAWAKAMELAGGDARRITILSASELIVR